MVVTYKDWDEMLPYALHRYHTLVCTFTGATPYSLVYGMEAVLPIEVEISSFGVLAKDELEETEWEGDLVLKKILPIQKDHRGKWTPNYEGPYVVKRAFSMGAMILTNMDGNDLLNHVNFDADKKFYP
ncbi:hypothetical protein CR513_17307, partial [Mucuna pruriens]